MSRRDAQVITAIWFGALFALARIGGENPTADAEIYGIILFVIVGSVATGVYLLVRETRSPQTTSYPESSAAPTPDPTCAPRLAAATAAEATG